MQVIRKTIGNVEVCKMHVEVIIRRLIVEIDAQAACFNLELLAYNFQTCVPASTKCCNALNIASEHTNRMLQSRGKCSAVKSRMERKDRFRTIARQFNASFYTKNTNDAADT